MQAPIFIQPLELADIVHITALQPPDWSDVASRFREHFGQSYFHPIKATAGNELVGIGQLFTFQNSAWLGNIIVRESWRGQGIGRMLTLDLIKKATALKHPNLYLLATAQGKPLYEQLGFETQSTYHFYQKPIDPAAVATPNPAIQRATPHHFGQMLALDELATGEDRSALLERYLPQGWVFENELQTSIQGFYLPHLGEGLIVAGNPNAGIALLNARHQSPIVIPTAHSALCQYLETQGYQPNRIASLMYLGKPKQWHPQLIYNRIGGYAG